MKWYKKAADLGNVDALVEIGALYKAFGRTWQRARQWGLLVLPPGVMPVCAQEDPYLQAALGLQQAGHLNSAQTAFQTAIRQWPLSTAAHMGLGPDYSTTPWQNPF